ncbi:DMT family transporter [Puniceicoccaceae bacterium K14]|nr:DMT family transporter [Puniceicoccaceae bacterium K14]
MFKCLLLILGVFCCSTAVILLKAAETAPLLVAAYRLLLASVFLSPFFLRDYKRHGAEVDWKKCYTFILPALFLSFHFVTWAWGARLTAVSNASLIINLAPVVMPFAAYAIVRERISVKEALGTLLAVCGVVILSWSDFRMGGGNLFGNGVCFVSMVGFTGYLAFGLKGARLPTVWLYIVPVYAIAGVMCLAVSLVALESVLVPNPQELLRIVVIAIVPTVIGHSILNYSLKSLKGQVVSVVNLHQFVFATTIGFFVFGELPPSIFAVAALLCSIGGVIVVRESR